MLRPSIKNIILFFFVKYFLFYFLLMFKNKDYTLIQIGSLRNGEDVFYYLWLFLFLPVMNIILFSVLIYFAFRAKREFYFVLFLIAFLIVEYFLYTYFASQTDLMNGVYNAILSVILLVLFFFKPMKSIFKRKTT